MSMNLAAALSKERVSEAEMRPLLLKICMAAESAEEFNDMYMFSRELVRYVITNRLQFTDKERNVIATAFKNVIGYCRSAFRSVDGTAPILRAYKLHLGGRVERVCSSVSLFIEQEVLPAIAQGGLDGIFWYKMAGDFRRYSAELHRNSQEHRQMCEDFYSKAMAWANESLSGTHSLRLGLCLNYTVACYEVMNEREKAIALAEEVYEGAVKQIGTVPRQDLNDVSLLVQMMRDNIGMWKETSGARQ